MASKFIAKQDIVREYSDTVAGLLATGWTIFTPSMGGSQGEDAHVDLINADHTVVARVLLYQGSDWGTGCHHKYIVEVRSYVPEDVHAKSWDETWEKSSFGVTIWNNKGTELSKRVFYAMEQGNNHYAYHYTTDAAVVAQAKARREYKNKLYERYYTNDNIEVKVPVDKLVKFVRKNGGRGYGSVKAEQLENVYKYYTKDEKDMKYVIRFKTKNALVFKAF